MLAGSGLPKLSHTAPCLNQRILFPVLPMGSREDKVVEKIYGRDGLTYQNWKESESALLCLPVFSLGPGLGMGKQDSNLLQSQKLPVCLPPTRRSCARF